MIFRIRDQGAFLWVRLCGELSTRDLLLCVRRCERFGLKRGATKNWLVDLTSLRDLQVGPYEMNVISRRFTSAAYSGSIRCAIVLRDLRPSSAMRRLRTVTARAEIEIRVFPSREESRKWLGRSDCRAVRGKHVRSAIFRQARQRTCGTAGSP